MKKNGIKKGNILIVALFAVFATLSCSNDKSAEMKDEIAAAYATATQSINNAKDEKTVAKINEELQTALSGIEAKYKDVTEEMSEEQKQTIAQFYNEQKELLYKNASETGKKFINAISTANGDAFGTTVSSLTKTLDSSVQAVQDTAKSVKDAAKNVVNNAQKALETTTGNARKAVEKAKSDSKKSVDNTIDNAKSTAKESANKAITNTQNKANEAINKAATKANEDIAKGINKALGK